MSRVIQNGLPVLLVIVALMFGGHGCMTWKWTSFDWVNDSTETIRVEDVSGFSELVEPGKLRPGTGPDSVGLNFGDPVDVERQIVIRWKIGDEHHEQILTRDECGLSKRLNGVTVRFIYQPDGKWRIEKIASTERP